MGFLNGFFSIWKDFIEDVTHSEFMEELGEIIGVLSVVLCMIAFIISLALALRYLWR